MHLCISLRTAVFKSIAIGMYFAFFWVQLSCQYHIVIEQDRYGSTVSSQLKTGSHVIKNGNEHEGCFVIKLNKRYQPESFPEVADAMPPLVPMYHILEKQAIPFAPRFTSTCLSLRLQRGPPAHMLI